jgi:hypothetical protein
MHEIKLTLSRAILPLAALTLLWFGAPVAVAQVQVNASFDELAEEAEMLEAGYFQQELELRREEISLLRQELELKRYEIQLLRKEMEPKQREISELREQIEAERQQQPAATYAPARSVPVAMPRPVASPRPTVEREGAILYKWCQVTNIPWRSIPSGGAVVQDGDGLGTFFKHAVVQRGILFVWARC